MVIAVTGATGNMGRYFLWALNLHPDAADKIKLLCRDITRAQKMLKSFPAIKEKVELVYGGITNGKALHALVEGCDIVFNLCGVIPPKSDIDPRGAAICNVDGVKTLVGAIESVKERQPALLHISSVAVYGNRGNAHMYGEVGEPLIATPLDGYSITKILGEYAILQSNVKKWAIFRQTAILHYNLFSDNLHGGLMFHTPFLAPLEWVSVKDSGRLLFNFLSAYKERALPADFFKKVYNVGGGEGCRTYGYQTYDEGFKIIGGGIRDFFKPYYNATRNFHGMFFRDSDKLENILKYRSQTCADFWKEFTAMHPIYKAGKAVPKPLIAKFAVKRLLTDENSPAQWIANGDNARAVAYFGGMEQYEKLKKLTWNDVPLPENIPAPQPLTYTEKISFYGYDIDKADKDISADDLKSVAQAHAGRLISAYDGDMYAKLEWETQDKERFFATPYAVLRAGHWEHSAYKKYEWDYDRLCKNDLIFARVWYDSHEHDEDNVYYFDENFGAHVRKTK